MPLERQLQYALHALLFLSTFLLAMGDHDSPWPLAMLGLIPLIFIFNDYLGWMRFFTGTVANWAALCGFVYFVIDFAQANSSQNFLPVINLLLILQLLLLLHEKSRRMYWFLLTLSILEVVIAAAMNLPLLFGILIFVYVGLAAVVLCLMTLSSESLRWSQRSSAAEPAAADALRSGMWRPAVLSAVAAAAFAILMQNTVPRLQGQQQGGLSGKRKLTGFSREVSLAEMSRVLESDALAMRVTLTESASGRPYRVAEELYLRGLSFQRYAPKSPGKWELRNSNPSPLPEAGTPLNKVEQEVWLEPTATPTLFAIAPVFRTGDTPTEINIDFRTFEVTRLSPPPPQARTTWHYRLGTTGLISGRQTAILPDPVFRDRIDMGSYYQEVRDCQAFDRRKFPQVAATAEEVLRNADALQGDTIRKTRVLESHFQNSSRYRYSLDNSFRRSDARDPIELFIAENRAGHCQYFATALALMLRSQRIPARIVIGYKGGEYNSVGNYWQFRQRDAHAWVEVHLSPAEVADLNLAGSQGAARGGWWRLDPTPVASRQMETGSSRWAQTLDYAEFVVSDSLAQWVPDRPRSVGNPIVDSIREPLTRIVEQLRRLPEKLRELGTHSLWNALGYPVFTAALLVVAAIVALRATRHRWLPRFAHWKKRLEAHARSGKRRRVRRSKLDFFDQFEQLLAAAGLSRSASDTPREWLQGLLDSGSIPELVSRHRGPASPTADAATDSGVAKVPAAPQGDRPSFEQFTEAAREIVDRFYKARYGGAVLEALERATVTQYLAVVADFLRPGPTSPATPHSSALASSATTAASPAIASSSATASSAATASSSATANVQHMAPFNRRNES